MWSGSSTCKPDQSQQWCFQPHVRSFFLGNEFWLVIPDLSSPSWCFFPTEPQWSTSLAVSTATPCFSRASFHASCGRVAETKLRLPVPPRRRVARPVLARPGRGRRGAAAGSAAAGGAARPAAGEWAALRALAAPEGRGRWRRERPARFQRWQTPLLLCGFEGQGQRQLWQRDRGFSRKIVKELEAGTNTQYYLRSTSVLALLPVSQRLRGAVSGA